MELCRYTGIGNFISCSSYFVFVPNLIVTTLSRFAFVDLETKVGNAIVDRFIKIGEGTGYLFRLSLGVFDISRIHKPKIPGELFRE
jgi:hypothetical protein